MKTHKKLLVLSIATIIIIAGYLLATSWATIVIKVEQDILAKNADLIIKGQVINSVSKEIQQEGGIYTFTTIRVEEAFKGDAEAEVVIKQFGGKIGDKVHVALGTSLFSENERVIAYLKTRGDGFFRVFGLSQGKYSIVKENESGKEVLERDLSGLEFIGERPEETVIYLEDHVRHLKLMHLR